jgi:hypothetical protein
MWKDRHKRLLAVVLDRVPKGLPWRLRWFDGVVHKTHRGRPPNETPIDIAFSDEDLQRLAASLEDLNDIALSANCPDGFLEVECEDSSRWTIRGSGSLSAVEAKFYDLM